MKMMIWILLMTFAVSVSTIIQSDSSSASASASATPSSKTWFREKYLIGSHDIYYEYTLHRFQLGDNDHDMCPDIHKTATLYAIIGRYLHEVKHTCSSLYVQKNNQRIHTDTDTDTDTHTHTHTHAHTHLLDMMPANQTARLVHGHDRDSA